MRKFKNWLVVVLFFSTTIIVAQTRITGTIVDESNQPLPGASIVVSGTSTGASSDFDGNFTLETSDASGTVLISYVGYLSQTIAFSGSTNLGTISLAPSAEALEEVLVIGVADIAKDRKTPVAVSTIRAAEIVEQIGTKEFPEILNSTPSVYATKQGGGFGDARINIRGFDQRNTAVMINGMPVNDMENGWVYWSNWAGLADVTSAMQVQRGLGSSKLAISSVGGTINVLTRASDMTEGGRVSATIGNDQYLKTLISYNTGKMDNGLSVSALFGRSEGDGFVQGTKFEGYNYYVAFGYTPNDDHDFQFTVTGAPQQHNQRGFAPSIGDYIKYGGVDGDPNIKYNSDFGYRNGKEDTFGGNFYHKPIASLNWDWNVSEKSTLASVLYASLGRGGSIGSIGRINNGRSYYSQFKDHNGHVKFNEIIQYNWGAGNGSPYGDRDVYTGGGDPSYQGMYVNGGDYNSPYVSDAGHIYGSENGISQRSSVNSHNWFGMVTNLKNELSETLTLDVGIDLRAYKGIHYRRLVDLLGADVYVNNDDINNPYHFTTKTYAPTIKNTWNVFKNIDDEEKIDYYNDGKVKWGGLFSQLEYNKDNISAFVQAAISQQAFKRIDYFNYLDSDPEQESDWEKIVGGNVKGGLNWNIDEMHNVFFNTGYYSKQPIFDAVFPSFTTNDTNEGLINEKVFGLELGYGLRAQNHRVNVNLYRTSWKDRFLRTSNTFFEDTPQEVRGTAKLEGVTQVHTGIEFESHHKFFDKVGVHAMVSVGNWEYQGDVSASYEDQAGNPIPGVDQETLYLEGVKVGDAAQFTARLGVDWDIYKGLRFNASHSFYDNLYANIDADDFDDPDHQGSLKLPNFNLMDLGLSYGFKVTEGQFLSFRFNVNNVFDEVYVSESDTNYHVREGDATWNGLSTGNRVYFGWGRTWNVGVSYSF